MAIALAYLPYHLIAQGIYTGLIGTISTMTIGTYGVIKSVYNHKNPDVNKFLAALDIERRLKIIFSVLHVIEKNSQNKLADIKLDDLEKTQLLNMIGEKNLENDPIELCLIYLHEIIKRINNDLDEINKKVIRHRSKWLNSWRKLNIKPLLENLELDSILLDRRFDDLTKISTFLNNR